MTEYWEWVVIIIIIMSLINVVLPLIITNITEFPLSYFWPYLAVITFVIQTVLFGDKWPQWLWSSPPESYPTDMSWIIKMYPIGKGFKKEIIPRYNVPGISTLTMGGLDQLIIEPQSRPILQIYCKK